MNERFVLQNQILDSAITAYKLIAESGEIMTSGEYSDYFLGWDYPLEPFTRMLWRNLNTKKDGVKSKIGRHILDEATAKDVAKLLDAATHFSEYIMAVVKTVDGYVPPSRWQRFKNKLTGTKSNQLGKLLLETKETLKDGWLGVL